MDPEIPNTLDRIFCHFGPFFALLPPSLTTWKIKIFLKKEKTTWRYDHFTHVYHKWQLHDVWFLRYGAWQTKFFVILDDFLHFYPPYNPKYQNFEKMKTPPGDIILLHMCTINDNHMVYGSWLMERDQHNFLSFWTIFCPFNIR